MYVITYDDCSLQVLKERLKAHPDDHDVPGQIKQIENYILQYNEKQMPTISRIREIVSNKSKENCQKSSDEDSEIRNEDIDKALSEEEILESLGLKNVARTSDGKIDHAKLTMKDRMAIVRGMRKKRKKILNSKKSCPSPGDDETCDNVIDDEEALLFYSSEAEQYKGFVTENQRFDAEPPEMFDDYDDDLLETEKKRRRIETDLYNCDKNQFLINLNLFTPSDVSSIVELLNEDARKKLNFRNMTYIPELSDKKHKVSYTYLAPDINSPPLLRTRQRRSQPETAVSSRLTSRSNSRATTPERSITRQLSSASNESENMSRKEEKYGLESELNGLTKRYDELQSVLAANKRTISTRVSIFFNPRIGEF